MATAYIRRQFNGAAVKTTLTGSTLSSSGTTFSIALSTGWPDGSVGPFIVCINRGNATEEKILVNSRSGLTCTTVLAQRGYDGTSAAQHVVGETVEIVGGAQDLDEANQLVSQALGTTTTAGDMLAASAANKLDTRVAAGTSGQVLVGGTPPAFSASPSITALTTSGAVTAGSVVSTGQVSGSSVKANGATGAAVPSRLIGGNVSGAPASGTWQVGDVAFDENGALWVCKTAGTPGTWVVTYAAQIAAKGDLLAGSGAGAITNLTVGSNTQVLTADSTQASGMKWATPATAATTQLARSVLGASGTISFTSISGSYNSLLIVGVVRSAAAATLDDLQIRFNNDSAAHYNQDINVTTNSTNTPAQGLAATQIAMTTAIIGNSGTAGYASAVRIWIPEYAATTFNKSCVVEVGGASATSAQGALAVGTGSWASTAAITRVDVAAGSFGNLLTGSTLTLYGIT